MTSYLANMTDEERAENLAKARQAKADLKAWAETHLRLNYADEPFHRELASKYNIKLPVRYHKAEGKYVIRVLKALGLDKEWYVSHSGFRNGHEEAKANPKMTAVEQMGIMLECYDDDLKHNRL